MTHRLLPRLVPFILLGVLLTSSPAPAAEPGTVEVEEVPDAEKIKWARATKISAIEAIKTATAHQPGQVIEAALHAIHGRLLYEVEIVTKDDRVVELFLDPRTGKLIPQGELKR